jgi:hypothetical protein
MNNIKKITKCLLGQFTILLIAQSAFGQALFTPQFQPKLTISRAMGSITIDGKLSDPGWKNAAELSNFVERYPGENIKPEVPTRGMVTYDENNLYAAFICYDDPGSVRSTMCQRDQFSGDDAVCLLLDTYNEGAWAYELFVNPYGIQKDKLWTKIAGEDAGYDFIWKSAAIVTDSGYQVEIAIPFQSLRFPDKEDQIWKMDFWRDRPRESFKQYSWAAYDRNDQCWVCQWGTVDGIRNIHPGSKGIEILPALVASQSGNLVPVNRFKNEKTKAEPSIGGKYTISSDITTEVAVNPDFSQIESDAAQIDVNTTIALFYPERRPYFQEGSDLFRTLFNSFYTRTISDPQFTAKLTARKESFSLGYLSAYDQNTPYMIPLDHSSILFNSGKSVVNVVRGLKTFGNNSQAGFIITDRRFDHDGSGTVMALDDNIRLSNNYSIDGQYIITHTKEPNDSALTADYAGINFDQGKHTAAFNGESYWGTAFISRLKRDARNWNFMLDYNQVSPAYRTETGYDPLVNYRHFDASSGYNIYFAKGIFERITPEIYAEKRWSFGGDKIREYINFGMEGQIRYAQTYFNVNRHLGSEIWIGKEYKNLWMNELHVGSTLNSQIAYDIQFDYGRDIARWKNVLGNATSIGAALSLKPLNRLIIEPTFNFLKSDEVGTGEKLYRGYITRVRTQFQATREFSVRAIVQYDDFQKSWDFDPLMTFRLNSFSVFYLGSAHNYLNIPGETDNQNHWRLNSRQYFLKLQYLFQPS